jgi:hypothetical protein
MPNFADDEGRFWRTPPGKVWHEAVEIPHAQVTVRKRCNCVFCVHERPGHYADFYTDVGQGITLTADDGETTSIGRYGVWQRNSRGKAEVVETFDTLAEVEKKYGEIKEVKLG